MTLCRVSGCTKPLFNRGFCGGHLSQIRRHGRILDPCPNCDSPEPDSRRVGAFCSPACFDAYSFQWYSRVLRHPDGHRLLLGSTP